MIQELTDTELYNRLVEISTSMQSYGEAIESSSLIMRGVEIEAIANQLIKLKETF
jgi:hypothetical protein